MTAVEEMGLSSS